MQQTSDGGGNSVNPSLTLEAENPGAGWMVLMTDCQVAPSPALAKAGAMRETSSWQASMTAWQAASEVVDPQLGPVDFKNKDFNMSNTPTHTHTHTHTERERERERERAGEREGERERERETESRPTFSLESIYNTVINILLV
jgi:hypothetical protein